MCVPFSEKKWSKWWNRNRSGPSTEIFTLQPPTNKWKSESESVSETERRGVQGI